MLVTITYECRQFCCTRHTIHYVATVASILAHCLQYNVIVALVRGLRNLHILNLRTQYGT